MENEWIVVDTHPKRINREGKGAIIARRLSRKQAEAKAEKEGRWQAMSREAYDNTPAPTEEQKEIQSEMQNKARQGKSNADEVKKYGSRIWFGDR